MCTLFSAVICAGNTALQRQAEVTTHLKSKQLQLFDFALLDGCLDQGEH